MLSISILVLVASLFPTRSTLAQTFSLKILHVNDHHSRLLEEAFGIETASLPSDVTASINITEIDEVSVTYGGFPRLVTLFSDLESASAADGVLKLHAGDAFAGSLFFTLYQGFADAEMMTPICFDAMTLGNHEFDLGNEVLETFIEQLSVNTSAACPEATAVISANVEPPVGSVLESQLEPFVVKTFNGEPVGIIGLTTSTSSLTSSPDQGTEFLPEVSALEAAIADLEGQGINKIIVMTHVGYDIDVSDIATIAGVDVVVGGHSHTLLGDASELDPLASPDGAFPTMVASDTNTACVVQAWEYAHGLGELDVSFDAEGNVVSCSGGPRFPYDNTAYTSDGTVVTNDVFTSGLTAYLDAFGPFVPAEPDSAVAAVLAVLEDGVDEFGNSVIANVPETICYERVPGQGRSNFCDASETLAQGGGACNLVAKAFLDQAPSADVAIQNGGGCRVDIEIGNYTVKDAFVLLPFSNTLVTLQMTGAEVIQVLNDAATISLNGTSTGAYPYASGLRYDVDANAIPGEHVSNVEVNIRLAGDWVPIDPSATYSVVTNNFIAAGRDGYTTFATISDVEDLFLEYANTFVQYAQQEGELLDPPLSEYSTQSFVPLATEPPSSFNLKILHVNDHHSRLLEEAFGIETASLPSDVTASINITEIDEVSVTYGGFPRLVTLFSDLESASAADGVLKLHAGDAFAGSLFFTLYQGFADAEMMTPICFDAMTLGNHEFDLGNEVLETFIEQLSVNTSAACPEATAVISANVEPPVGSVLESQLEPFVVKTFNGEPVGIIGLTTSTSSLTSSPDQGTEFLPEVSALEAAIADLEGQGINKIIVMTHVGYDIDVSDIATIAGVDVVVGGHSHTLLGDASELDPLASPDGAFPTMVASDTNTACVVQAWEYAHGLGELDVSFDAEGNVVSCSGGPRFPYDNTAYTSDGTVVTNDVFTSGLTAYLDAFGPFVPAEPDSAVAAVLAVLEDGVDEFGNSVIANVPETICYERVPGQGRSNFCDASETLAQGGGACNLVAKAFLDQAPSADVAIQNGGGCRVDIEIGNYTVKDAFVLLPFSNTLVTLQMTGAEVIQVLNDAATISLNGTSTGAYPYASGLRYDVDANAIPGEHVSNVEVNIRLAGDWVPIDPSATYSVVTNNFIAAGRDGYTTFATISDVEDLFLEYANTFVQYAQQEGELLDPPLSEYSTQSFVPLTDTEPTMEPSAEVSSGSPSMQPSVQQTAVPSMKPSAVSPQTPDPTTESPTSFAEILPVTFMLAVICFSSTMI